MQAPPPSDRRRALSEVYGILRRAAKRATQQPQATPTFPVAGGEADSRASHPGADALPQQRKAGPLP
jgi:hypothetical protein